MIIDNEKYLTIKADNIDSVENKSLSLIVDLKTNKIYKLIIMEAYSMDEGKRTFHYKWIDFSFGIELFLTSIRKYDKLICKLEKVI